MYILLWWCPNQQAFMIHFTAVVFSSLWLECIRHHQLHQSERENRFSSWILLPCSPQAGFRYIPGSSSLSSFCMWCVLECVQQVRRSRRGTAFLSCDAVLKIMRVSSRSEGLLFCARQANAPNYAVNSHHSDYNIIGRYTPPMSMGA